MSSSKHIPPNDAGPLLDKSGNVDPSYVPDFASCTLPYCTWYQSDFLGGVRGMKAIEIGIYSVLLNEMYERGEALDIPLKRLARMCGTTPKALKSALDILIEEEKIIQLDCGLWNEKVQKVFTKREKSSQSNSRAGQTSARKRNKINGGTERAFNDGSAEVQPSSEAQSIENNNSEDKSSSLLLARARDNDDPYLEFLDAHPRPRETDRGEAIWSETVAAGTDPSEIISGARRYADAAKSFDGDKVKFSDNWLDDEGWKKYPAPRLPTGGDPERANQTRANSIKSGKRYLCAQISPFHARDLVDAGLVTEAECEAVGVL